jgi:large repetitive protein
MATKTWTSGPNWSTATWTNGIPVAGDDVVLNRSGSHTLTLDVDTPSLKSLSFGSSGGSDTLDVGSHILNVNYAGSTGISLNGGDISIAGGTINDTSDLSANTGNISGYGTLNVGGTISGAGTLTASGGTLDVFGTINSGINFVIGTSTGSTLKIEGTATASSAITIDNSHQTLEIGASGALTSMRRKASPMAHSS